MAQILLRNPTNHVENGQNSPALKNPLDAATSAKSIGIKIPGAQIPSTPRHLNEKFGLQKTGSEPGAPDVPVQPHSTKAAPFSWPN